MRKNIALLFFFIFLLANVSQLCKIYFTEEISMGNVLDNEKDVEKKSAEDTEDFLKEKISHSYSITISIFSFSSKQYMAHIFQYKNPFHEIDILPPETIILS